MDQLYDTQRPFKGPILSRLLATFVLSVLPCILSLSSASSSKRQRSSSSSPINLPQHPQQPLNSQQRRQESLQVGHHPLLSLNLNLDALARAQAPERAQELYQRISALYEEGYYAVAPDVVSFNSVLKAWQSDPESALQFWEQELAPLGEENDRDGVRREGCVSHHYRRSSRRPLEPNVRSYNTFLLALARAGMFQPAELLLRQMQDAQSLVVPDRITYNTVLLAYCASDDDPTAPVRATSLLHELIQSDYLKPDVVSFNTVLSTWVHVGTESAVQTAEDVLFRMSEYGVSPDVCSYTTVLHGWAQCGKSQRALSLLQHMMTNNQPPLQPNQITYTVVVQALCRDGKPHLAHQLVQDLFRQALDESENSLAKLGTVVRPDVVMCSALMQGWADWIRPSHTTPQKATTAVQSVMQLLQQMKELSRDGGTVSWGDLAPNEVTYTSVLSTLARSRHYLAGPQAEKLLNEMVLSVVQPSVLHWNAVLDAYAKSPRLNKLQDAKQVYSKLLTSQISPDTVTYNTLLAAAANSFGKGEDLHELYVKTGLDMFETLQLDPNCQFNSLSFHYVFKIIRKFMPLGVNRQKRVRQLFDLCCQCGCLSEPVLKQLLEQVVSSEEETKALFGERWQKHLSIRNLPSSWSRHAYSSRAR